MIHQHRYSDFVKLLPRRLQIRFEALGGYVRSIVSEELETPSLTALAEILEEEITFIQLIVFVYSLERFLEDGSRAARSAAETFESLGAASFAIGQSVFTRDNDNTTRGERLALELRDLLADAEYGEIVRSARSMRELIRRLIREMRYAKHHLG